MSTAMADNNMQSDERAAMSDTVEVGPDFIVTNVPQRIFLNLGDIDQMGEFNFHNRGDVTWCADKIFDTDIEYVRVASPAAAQPNARETLEDAKAKLVALLIPNPEGEHGPTDEPESQYRFGYNTAIEDALEALLKQRENGNG